MLVAVALFLRFGVGDGGKPEHTFDVTFSAGQRITVVSSTNVEAALNQWPILLTTNAPGTRFRVSDPRAATNTC